MNHRDFGATLSGLRRGIGWLLAAGLAGTGTELLLMGHTEDLLQLIPLLLIGLSLGTLLWHAVRNDGRSLRFLRVVMLLSILSGVTGTVLHYRGNIEFEIEMTPGLSGFDLFKEAVTGATPALAPGTMILLGVLGLLFTLGHPRLREPSIHTEDS